MASLLDRDGTQYANFYDSNRKPKQKRFSLKTKSKKVARRLLADLEDAYAAGKWDPWLDTLEGFHDRPTKALTLGQARTLYMEAKRAADLSEHTLRDYRSTLRGLTDAVGTEQALERLTAAQVARYTQSDEVARSTRRKRHDTVKAFLNWLRERDDLDAEPMKLMQPPKQKEGLPRALRPAMLEKMLTALSESESTKDVSWHGRVWRFACASGLRVRELARLRWGHVDKERGVIELKEQKNGNAGTAPLTDQAARVLGEIGEGRPEEYVFRSPEGHATERSANAWCRNVSCTFARYREAAGLPGRITFHSTRHAFCVRLAEAGKSAFIIKEAARHGSVKVSQRYVRIAGRKLRDEVNDVFG